MHDDLLGKKVQCPECRHTFTASAPEEIATPVKVAKVKEPSWQKEEPSSKTETKKRKRRSDDDDDDDRDYDDDVDIRRSSTSLNQIRQVDILANETSEPCLTLVFDSADFFDHTAWRTP